MLKSVEGNFNDPEVDELLNKHFIELRAASVSYTHLTLPTICSV